MVFSPFLHRSKTFAGKPQSPLAKPLMLTPDGGSRPITVPGSKLARVSKKSEDSEDEDAVLVTAQNIDAHAEPRSEEGKTARSAGGGGEGGVGGESGGGAKSHADGAASSASHRGVPGPAGLSGSPSHAMGPRPHPNVEPVEPPTPALSRSPRISSAGSPLLSAAPAPGEMRLDLDTALDDGASMYAVPESPATAVWPAVSVGMHFAAWSGDSAALRVFLQYGESPNTIDGRGRTPLHYAAETGDLECVRLLLDAGAWTTLDLLDSSGKSPVDLARDMGHRFVVQLLNTPQ